MEYAIHLFILLVAARVFGRLAQRFGQPSSVGEILGGVAVALLIAPLSKDFPILLDLTHGPAITIASEVGIFFLLLYAGIEMPPQKIASH